MLCKVGKFFYENDAFAKKFEDFVNANAHIIDLDELNATGQNKLSYTSLYDEYQSLFDSSLSSYIESLGCTVLDFYEAMMKATETDKEGEEAIFGMIMTATADFDIFMQMMKEARLQQTRK